MRPIGFVLIAVLSTLWLLSISTLLLAIPLLFCGIYAPIKLLLLYRLFRFLHPARRWPKLYMMLTSLIHKYPYFLLQALAFESPSAVPERNSSTLLAVFPHGAICIGGTINLVLSRDIQQAEVRLLGSSMLFQLPGLSDILAWCSVGKVSKRFMTSLMGAGQNLALYPGGFEEAALYRRSQHNVFLKERKGFVKYALRFGYKISPVYTFGEVDTYHALAPGQRFRLRMARKKIPGILFWSRLGWLPDPNNKIVTVIGDPIQMPTISDPTHDDVDLYHGMVIDALQRLFDKYKGEYDRDPGATLNIS